MFAADPATSYRVDRQLFGRAARQGDPGSAQLFAAADDELLLRHAPVARRLWRTLGPDRIIRLAQARAERLARFNRRQVLRSDDWMDQSLPF
jgi:preprotein translocase subunit SecA